MSQSASPETGSGKASQTAGGWSSFFVVELLVRVLQRTAGWGDRVSAQLVDATYLLHDVVFCQKRARPAAEPAKSRAGKAPRPSPPSSGPKRRRSSAAAADADAGAVAGALLFPAKAPAKGRASKASTPAPSPDRSPSPEPVTDEDRPVAEEGSTERRVRALKKKLRDVDEKEQKVAAGRSKMNAELAQKVADKPGMQRQLQELMVLAAQEAKDAAAAEVERLRAEAERAAAEKAKAEKRAAERAAADAALAKARREALEVLPNISPCGDEAKSDPRVKALLSQVSDLSEEIFNDDVVKQGVSKRSGWRLTLLARPIAEDPLNKPEEEPTELLGFIVFRFRPDMQCLSISKLAVPEQNRGRGFGRHLMEWVTKYAKQQGSLQYLSLSSLPEAVGFYQNFGFKALDTKMVTDQEDLIEGQVFMEMRLKGGRRSFS